MTGIDALLSIYHDQTKLWSLQEYKAEANRLIAHALKEPERKRAHTVRRVWPVTINGQKKYYRVRYHYAPEIGYWGCVKDNHGNLVLNTEAYCLASTVRQIVSEFMTSIDKGVWE